MLDNKKVGGIVSVYLLGFVFAFQVAIPSFISSNFLNKFIPENLVGIIYLSSYFFTILGFLIMPFILKRFGNYRIALFLMFINIIALLGLSFLENSFWLISLFMLNTIIIPLIYFSNDIFLEGFSSNKETGIIRGIYLTAVNTAWFISPYITSKILGLTGDNYQRVYFSSLITIIILFYILIIKLRNFKDSNYESIPFLKTLKLVSENKNIFNIVLANFLLYFFYSWVVIYIPLYLYKYIGFLWKDLGIIFSIMLLPFVLFQIPLGRLADKFFGEKEILSLGFIITAISTSLIFWITTKSLILWALILFMTRVGASTIEIMCDTYLFKKVSGLNADIISLYRMFGTLAYIMGPLLATIILLFLDLHIKYLFLILGFIMLIGLRLSLYLKDTK